MHHHLWIHAPDSTPNSCFPRKIYHAESVNCFITSSNVQAQPDVFKTAMFIVFDDFDSPSHRIRGNYKWRIAEFLYRGTKLFGFPGFNLDLVVFSVR